MKLNVKIILAIVLSIIVSMPVAANAETSKIKIYGKVSYLDNTIEYYRDEKITDDEMIFECEEEDCHDYLDEYRAIFGSILRDQSGYNEETRTIFDGSITEGEVENEEWQYTIHLDSKEYNYIRGIVIDNVADSAVIDAAPKFTAIANTTGYTILESWEEIDSDKFAYSDEEKNDALAPDKRLVQFELAKKYKYTLAITIDEDYRIDENTKILINDAEVELKDYKYIKDTDLNRDLDVKLDEDDKKNNENLENYLTEIVSKVINKEEITGLDETTKNAVLNAIKENKKITSKIDVTELNKEEISDSVKEKVANKNVLGFFNIDLVLFADLVSVGRVEELSQSVTVSIDTSSITMPELKRGYERTYKVLRFHGETPEEISVKVNEDGTLSFETDKFSLYVLTYEDTEKKTTEVKDSDEEKEANTDTKTETKDAKSDETEKSTESEEKVTTTTSVVASKASSSTSTISTSTEKKNDKISSELLEKNSEEETVNTEDTEDEKQESVITRDAKNSKNESKDDSILIHIIPIAAIGLIGLGIVAYRHFKSSDIKGI